MSEIRVAIAGLGNCASSLIQGVNYYADPANDTVSRRHAHIRLDAGEYRICDDGSEFGTRVFRDGRSIEVPRGNRRGERLRARQRLTFAHECLRAGGALQSIQLEDVVGVRMGQQNQRKRQLLLADELQHRIGIRARIQRRRFTRLRIEYDIRVDRHVAKRCGKGRKAVERAGVDGDALGPSAAHEEDGRLAAAALERRAEIIGT